MELALYTPGLGYYARDSLKFGALPYQRQDGRLVAGSDFVTAPEISPLFGQTLAAQLQQALQQTHTDTLWEFGAGSGALALQLLSSWAEQGKPLPQYRIVELSATLRARQQATLAAVAAVLLGMQYGVINPHIGFLYGIKAFTAAVLGGIGSIPGAMLGGLLLGVAEAFGADVFGDQYKDVVAFGLLVLVLLFRPTGILGRPEVEKV